MEPFKNDFLNEVELLTCCQRGESTSFGHNTGIEDGFNFFVRKGLEPVC